MFNKESGGRWQSLLPLLAFLAGESEGGSASRIYIYKYILFDGLAHKRANILRVADAFFLAP